MSSSFADSFPQFGGESQVIGEKYPLGDDYLGPDPFSNFDSAAPDSPLSVNVPSGESASDPAYFSSETNADGPIFPPLAEMEPEEGYALREWRRQNAIRLEEKENRAKELLSQIIVESDKYKVEFHRKGQLICQTNKATNREKEKVFVAIQEKFHSEADKDYWKSIAELIPKEVRKIEKRKGKKDQDKKPLSFVVEGPKPGKPTDLSRMRQILVKLKHNTPIHLKPSRLDANAAPKANSPVAVSSVTLAVA